MITCAKALSIELATTITPASRRWSSRPRARIQDIYELTYIRKDGSRFPAVVSVMALRDEHDAIIGYLLIGTDNTARKLVEADKKAGSTPGRAVLHACSRTEFHIYVLMTTDPSASSRTSTWDGGVDRLYSTS